MNPFVWKVRVYWEDTDAGGVVYQIDRCVSKSRQLQTNLNAQMDQGED